MTGTGAKKGSGEKGLLCFFDKATLEPVRKIGVVPDGSVTSFIWNDHTNQIIVGGTDGTRALYNPTMSQKGALLCIGKHKREKDGDVTLAEHQIYNPHALPMYR